MLGEAGLLQFEEMLIPTTNGCFGGLPRSFAKGAAKTI